MIQIAIFGSRHQDRYLEPLGRLFETLLSHSRTLSLQIEERFYNYIMPTLPQVDWSRIEVFQHLSTAPDMALSIGGDGTFLRVSKAVGRLGCPIMGINTGHLGYMSAASIDEPGQVAEDIISGNYRLEPRAILRVSCDNPDFHGPRYALNEVAILRRDTASMISIDASLDGEPLATYRGDGLIISTPTGSTGYNLSVGGPIVSPTTPCWIVSPIAPHSLNMRPLVVPDSSQIELQSAGRTDTLLVSLDGKATVLPIDTRLRVTRAPMAIQVVHRGGQSFIDTIRTKLLWGTRHDD